MLNDEPVALGSMRGRRVWVALIFVHYLVYEVVYFFYSATYPVLGAFTSVWKILVPLMLAIVVGLPYAAVLKTHRRLTFYLTFFALFLAWALVASIFSAGAVVEWFKLIPRFGFFLAVAIFFIRVPQACLATGKLIVGWALLAVLQYVLANVTAAYSSLGTYAWGGLNAGPYGVLGNMTSIMYIPNIHTPVIRLAGFWNEPSNASASLFASSFLARWIHLLTNERRWRWAAWVCLAGGFACLSDAGYVAVGVALLLGAVTKAHRVSRAVRNMFLGALGVLLVWAALVGRVYVAEHLPDNEVLRAVTGLRDSPQQIQERGADEALAGRLGLVSIAIDAVVARPFGVGLMSSASEGGSAMSASAPVMWLLLVGPVGLAFILLRDIWVWRSILVAGRGLRPVMLAGQAFVVVFVQHMSYGSWMNPLFFITAAMVFATESWIRSGMFVSAQRQLQPRRNAAPKTVRT